MAKEKKATPGYVISGLVRDAETHRGLGGYVVTAFDVDRLDEFDFLGRTYTHANGEFRLLYRQEDFIRSVEEESLEGGADILIILHNRFGREIKRIGPLIDAQRFEEVCIDVKAKREENMPLGPPLLDPFDVLKDKYRKELSILRNARITNREEVMSADLNSIAKEQNIPVESLEAFRLHTELAYVDNFDADAAKAFVQAGIKTREQVAGAKPSKLVAIIEMAKKQGNIDAGKELSPSMVFGWVGYAKGMDPKPFANKMNIKQILRDARKVTEAVNKQNLGATIVGVGGLLNSFNRLQAMTEARTHMEAAGVSDLSALGTFKIRGRRVIGPGYHVATPPFFGPITALTSEGLFSNMIKKQAGYKSVKSIQAFTDALHFMPNPITDAVIIGSLIDFIEDGKLVIGRDVTSLTIITEEIRYSEVNEITYEDKERAPEPRAAMSPARGATGYPRNDRNVYTPNGGNRGRNGGTGSNGQNGGAGYDGNILGPAPNVTIYVQRTPEGLPDIRIEGRRGGVGQPGQHGGHGSDGARGRGASSGVCYCHRSVGRGGDGGDGGRGGNGGIGGAGASGPELRIVTLDENIITLAVERPYFVDISGGPGGSGGSAGIRGDGGRGGAPGDDSGPWCDAEPSRVGSDGSRGQDGNRGPDGPDGPDGVFTLQPVTLSDWNAVFNLPWIIRLEPYTGVPGTNVHIVARNITDDTSILYNGISFTPTAIDVDAGTLDFVLPLNAIGGLHSVQLRIMGVNDFVYSNTVGFRVTPHLDTITPDNGVPSTTIALHGRGFVDGAQVRFGEATYPATFLSSTELEITLPDHEDIATDAGPKEVCVVNPDGRESEFLIFQLTLDIIIRVKAWIAWPENMIVGGSTIGTPVPERDSDDIMELFTEGPTPRKVWIDHNIVLEFDPIVGTASVPADWASSWPIDDVTYAENIAVIKAVDDQGNYLHFEEGAINFYFVDDIDDWTTHAYTYRGSEATRREFVIFEDTPLLSDWEEAHVAAHECGHIFGLPHVCGDEDDVTFERECDEDEDRKFLMFPTTNLFIDEGNGLTAEEIRIARRVSRLWHNL